MIILRILLGLVLGGTIAFAFGFGVATALEQAGTAPTPAAHASPKPASTAPAHPAAGADKGGKR